MKMKRYGVNVRQTALQPQEKQRNLQIKRSPQGLKSGKVVIGLSLCLLFCYIFNLDNFQLRALLFYAYTTKVQLGNSDLHFWHD